MQQGFWAKLQKPIFALAPMANVTDAAFRRIIAKYSRPAGPAVFWTEFVSVEGLLSRGREKLLPDFWFTEAERPIVAQIFGGKPEQFYEVAKLIVSLGFDGIDINMGCPDKGVEKSGGGAALIKNPKLAQKVILETKRGIADASASGRSSIPVSVKTRLGYNKDEIETWLPALFETGLAALTIHLRTRKEMSLVPAHWEWASRAVALRDKYGPETLLLGNGDIPNLTVGRQLSADHGLDGVMLGRAIFGNPWLFAEKIPTTEEKLSVCVEHTKLFEELYGAGTVQSVIPKPRDLTPRIKPFDLMKKHFKAYVSGFSAGGGSASGGDGGALKVLRMKMMEAETAQEIEKIVANFFKK